MQERGGTHDDRTDDEKQEVRDNDVWRVEK